ncbi:hypothetical protein [uncultured Enterovirga sp.]|uniref:hypothetical protein n=1 Tax=uncultured Enterovirga sp. TaxID=2026352 RepID=UPI0035C9BA1D
MPVALACASCTEYLARRDTLSAGSGDAVQANIAKHVIDPWPRVAQRDDTEMDGERLRHAVERYRNPSSGGASSSAPAGAVVSASSPTR